MPDENPFRTIQNSQENGTQATWQRTLHPTICENCDWLFLSPTAVPGRCPHCYAAELTQLEPDDAPDFPAPELILPFAVSDAVVQERLDSFARSVPFEPPSLKPAALRKQLRMVYLPTWLVDSNVQAVWQAEVGFDYQVVSHQERYANGSWQTIELEETKVRWEQRIGRMQRHFSNVVAPALDEHDVLRERLGSFPLSDAEKYAPEVVDEALVRLPNRDTVDAWPDAELRLQQVAREECRQAAAGQHIRQFRWEPQYAAQNWTQLLVPIYSTHYLDDDDQPLPVILNGRTGQVTGIRRASMRRAKRYMRNQALIALAMFLFTLVLIAIDSWLALPLGLLTAVMGLGAIYPVARASQFNRSQRETLPLPLRTDQ